MDLQTRMAMSVEAEIEDRPDIDLLATYISKINVSLEDPDHPVTLEWVGPLSTTRPAGPFRSSPGAGLVGLDCNDVSTCREAGSKCTPKGTFLVQGFAQNLNSDMDARFVTWFCAERGIGLHYYPYVPAYCASHGCVRLELESAARLILESSRVGVTTVTVEGTWKKPPKQW